MTPELVIFDCDGVLVDTELTANIILAEVITDLGVPITAQDCQARFMGRTLESVKELVEELCSVELADDWPDYIRERDLEAFAKGVDPIPGITAVLDDLDRRGVPYCVGSSGKYEKMRMTLGSSGLLPRLEGKLYSAQDCANGKPAPDVFLLAAKGMGKDPACCVVVEDSVPGLMAARSAGMRGFGYTADPHCDKKAMLEAGGTLFDRMEALPELLFPSK